MLVVMDISPSERKVVSKLDSNWDASESQSSAKSQRQVLPRIARQNIFIKYAFMDRSRKAQKVST